MIYLQQQKLSGELARKKIATEQADISGVVGDNSGFSLSLSSDEMLSY